MKGFFKSLFSKDGKSSVMATIATGAALGAILSSNPDTQKKFAAVALLFGGGTGFVSADSKTKKTREEDEKEPKGSTN